MVNCTCARDGAYMWVARNFGECLYSDRELAHFVVGMSSLFFWTICVAPQFIKNYQNKSAGALSKFFIAEWFLGDTMSMVGAVLTHQLVTQLATGVLFLVNDVLMISQMVYYTYHARRRKGQGLLESAHGYESLDGAGRGERDEESEVSVIEAGDHQQQQAGGGRAVYSALAAVVLPLGVVLVSNGALGGSEQLVPLPYAQPGLLGADQLLPDCEDQTKVSPELDKLGQVLGWISSVVYLNSRLPQILKNYRRGSVEGLSVVMFTCAVLGNTTYGMGVLLKDSSWAAVKKAAPWLVGSFGTLFLDFTILFQFWYFTHVRPPAVPAAAASAEAAAHEHGAHMQPVAARGAAPSSSHRR